MKTPTSFSLIIALVAAALTGAIHADIEKDNFDGQVVFRSRPDRKPGSSPPAVASRRQGTHAPGDIMELITSASRKNGLDPELVAAVVSVESAFNPRAVSPKGARGLMQLMPQTAREYGVNDVHDPAQNLAGGTAYLRALIRRFNGDMRLALAAYNAGPGAVERAGGVPDYPETIGYIRKIEARFGSLENPGQLDQGKNSSSAIFSAGSIRPTHDGSGNVVWTNRRGKRTRVIGKR